MLPRLVTLRKMQEPTSGSEKMFKIGHSGFWATSGQNRPVRKRGDPQASRPSVVFNLGLGRDPASAGRPRRGRYGLVLVGWGNCRKSCYVACMFKRRTLFVVGAGASQEVGFPLGTELAKSIGQRLIRRIDQETRRASFNDSNFYDQLRRFSQNEVNEYYAAAGRIAAGIRLASSIDDFPAHS
jgi:hypothetical protein